MIARHAPIDPHLLARTILSEKRFRIAVPSTHRTLWETVWDWLSALWARLSDALFSHVHIGSRASMLIGDALAFALIALVVVMLVRLVLASVRDARRPTGAAALLDNLPDAQTFYELSRTAAARGDYRSAIAFLFRAALLRLAGLEEVREDPSRTVNQWRRALARARPNAVPAFDAIALPFVAAFYAETPVAQAQWLSARDAYAALPGAHSDG